MNYSDFTLERPAYRIAGQVVMAAQLGVPVESASTVFIEERPPGIRLAKLFDYGSVDTSTTEMARRAEDRAAVRIAAPVAEVIYTAQRYEEAGCSVKWPQWRESRKKRLAGIDDADFDFAFAYIFAWSVWQTWNVCQQRFDELWRSVEILLRERAQWKGVERVAASLLDLDVLTGEEAMDVIAAS